MAKNIRSIILVPWLVLLTASNGFAQDEKEEGGILHKLKSFTEGVANKFKKREPLEPHCLSLDESYQIADNAKDLAIAASSVKVSDAFNKALSGRSAASVDVQDLMKKISLQYVWIPSPMERQIGDAFYNSEANQKRIIQRAAIEKNEEIKDLYDKLDKAFEMAIKEYASNKFPYKVSLYITRVTDEINAEALPGGYIYVTRGAVDLLSDDGLKFMVGHEIAHLAKRHTSKELQQRMIDLGLAAKVFQQVMRSTSVVDVKSVFESEKIIEVFRGKFAKYVQGQELQADGCSARSLSSLKVDAPAAFKDFSSKRGKEKKVPAHYENDSPSVPDLSTIFTDHSSHPEDDKRLENVVAAYRYHLGKKQ